MRLGEENFCSKGLDKKLSPESSWCRGWGGGGLGGLLEKGGKA